MLLLMILTLIPFIFLLLFPLPLGIALGITPPLKADPYHLWNPLGLVLEGESADLVYVFQSLIVRFRLLFKEMATALSHLRARLILS
jgi:hypothetical protein